MNDLAGREVLACRLVRLLREAPNQLLEDVAHLQVADLVRVQVNLTEPGDHQIEQAGLVETGDLLVKAKLLEGIPRLRAEGIDVAAQVSGDVIRVGEQPGEVQLALVVEALPGNPVQDGIDVLDLAVQLLILGKNSFLGGRKHAVQAAQKDERKDDPPILIRLVVSPQQVGNRPDEPNFVLEPIHRSGPLSATLPHHRLVLGYTYCGNNRRGRAIGFQAG